MKELIDELRAALRDPLFYASVQKLRAGAEKAIAALEAAEAREAELRARVAELEGMVPKWVPVSERLPEGETGYQYMVSDGVCVDTGFFMGEDDDEEEMWDDTDFDVTHWMPLPAAPKEQL